MIFTRPSRSGGPTHGVSGVTELEQAAANFLGLMSRTREEVKSDHVLLLAEKWLVWVEREPRQ